MPTHLSELKMTSIPLHAGLFQICLFLQHFHVARVLQSYQPAESVWSQFSHQQFVWLVENTRRFHLPWWIHCSKWRLLIFLSGGGLARLQIQKWHQIRITMKSIDTSLVDSGQARMGCQSIIIKYNRKYKYRQYNKMGCFQI